MQTLNVMPLETARALYLHWKVLCFRECNSREGVNRLSVNRVLSLSVHHPALQFLSILLKGAFQKILLAHHNSMLFNSKLEYFTEQVFLRCRCSDMLVAFYLRLSSPPTAKSEQHYLRLILVALCIIPYLLNKASRTWMMLAKFGGERSEDRHGAGERERDVKSIEVYYGLYSAVAEV